MDLGLKCKMQNDKHLRKKIGKTLWDLGPGDELLDLPGAA